MLRVHLQDRSVVLADHVEKAETLLQRLKGLLGRSHLTNGHGLWIEPCQSIHTWFMRFPIDVVFVSRETKVVATYENVTPFRLIPWVPCAQAALELPAGALKRCPLKKGDQLILEN